MPRVGPPRKRQPVCWWTEDTAELRKKCNRLRRRYQRTRRDDEVVTTVSQQYQQARRTLKLAIRQSKKAAWEEFCQEADDDPFGKPYKVVMRKAGGPSVTSRMEPGVLQQVVQELFPSAPR